MALGASVAGEQWPAEQQWAESHGYLMSLATLGPAPVKLHDRFGPISEDAIAVPISACIRTNKKLKQHKKIVYKPTCCQKDPGALPTPCCAKMKSPKIVRDNIAEHGKNTHWTMLKATQNYENFHNAKNGTELWGETDIKVIEDSSLGVQGWALHDVGRDDDDSSWASENYQGGEDPLSSDEEPIDGDVEELKIHYGADGPLDFTYQYDAWEMALDDAYDEQFSLSLRDKLPSMAIGEDENMIEDITRQPRECGNPGALEGKNTLRGSNPKASIDNKDTQSKECGEVQGRWQTVASSRRGGRQDSLRSNFELKKCTCTRRSTRLFCTSTKCRNDQSNMPSGSVTTGRVHTEDGSPKSTITSTRTKAPLQPKPDVEKTDIPVSELETVLKQLRHALTKVDSSTNLEILDSLKVAADKMELETKNKFWTTEAGQAELLRRFDASSEPPAPNLKAGQLFVFDYSEESKAMLSSAGDANAGEEWFEIELTADTGACDTVIPRTSCPKIPIQSSLQSLRQMEYEIADGSTIPNLGERRCLMWTEDATQARHINMQVADVHKALLSLSRCADMGFESRFGRTMGALIDEDSGEVIPLKRREFLCLAMLA